MPKPLPPPPPSGRQREGLKEHCFGYIMIIPLLQFEQYSFTLHLDTLVYCCVGLDHIVILFTIGLTQHMVYTW